MSCSLALAPAAFAGSSEDPPPPHHHPSGWYSGWSLVIAGGVSRLVGWRSTTKDDPSTPAVGWSLAGMGTVWVAGALILKLTSGEQQKQAGR